MKKIAGIVALISAVVLTSCGGADSHIAPFVGKIEFKFEGMGMSSNGSITMDAENERVTYRMDALEKFMGIDVAMMVDMKKNMTYTICPSKGIYMESEMKKEDVKAEMPSKKEIEEMKKEFFSKLKKTGNQQEINGLTCDEYELKENTEGVESATIWVSKTMLNRMTANWSMMPELKDLGIDELMIGFPMKGSFKADGQSGSFEVTKITEGKEALTDFDLSKMKKVESKDFYKEVMGESAIGEMMEGFEEMEEKGYTEDLAKELEKLKDMDLDIDTKELEKLMESLK